MTRRHISLFGVQNKETQESLELLMMAVPITIMDKFVNKRIYAENLKAMILPTEFGDEKYKLPNLMYKKAYGIAYDDET